MDTRYLESSPRLVGPHHHHHSRVKTTFPPSHPPQTVHSDNDRSAVEVRALDCNLTALCDHIRTEGFGSGAFSDVVLHVMGSTFHLHRLILSRSPYFRNMLHGPWKEASSSIVTLHVDDKNVNEEAISVALAYLYGHHPKLNDNNAFRVLAAASFLDLQDLCAICTDFIISELWTSNFLEFQVFAESQDYGVHGERVKNACWGYLCQSGAMELKEVLPKLSSQTLHALLTSDELWVPSEEKRFELALCAFRAKGALSESEQPEQGDSRFGSGTTNVHSDSLKCKGKQVMDACSREGIECELGHLRLKDNPTNADTSYGPMVELKDCVIDFQRGVSGSQATYKQSNMEPVQSSTMDRSSPLDNSFSNQDEIRTCSYMDMPIIEGNDEVGEMAMEGPSGEGMCYHLSEEGWVSGEVSRQSSSLNPSCNTPNLNERGRSDVPALTWGGRVVGSREHKGYTRGKCGFSDEEFDAFEDIFEGGSLLYSNMSFDALLTVRKHLEELGFPCKAVNDGLWLQMLLSQRVLETAANTCTKCCLMRIACACAPAFGLSHGATITTYYNPENTNHENTGNIYVSNPNQGEENGIFRPVRVYVRGQHIDGLAGIGCGATYVPPSAWPPTRFVYSRVPINRHDQQTLANDDPEGRNDQSGEISGDGLTALVGLSQGGNCSGSVHGEQTETVCNSNIPVEMLEQQEHSAGFEWESRGHSSISLDMKTPLSHFPPFRFGVEFEDVHRLCDGQVKHSSEFYYAGSFWKVSVQAFNDEDPQGRRTLGLFLHRRKAEPMVSPTKSNVYVDSREKVTARYQLICPSKKEVMVFGSFKQRGTLLPKAPKGWGWRTALLFDELSDLLQNGALRVASVVQLV